MTDAQQMCVKGHFSAEEYNGDLRFGPVISLWALGQLGSGANYLNSSTRPLKTQPPLATHPSQSNARGVVKYEGSHLGQQL